MGSRGPLKGGMGVATPRGSWLLLLVTSSHRAPPLIICQSSLWVIFVQCAPAPGTYKLRCHLALTTSGHSSSKRRSPGLTWVTRNIVYRLFESSRGQPHLLRARWFKGRDWKGPPRWHRQSLPTWGGGQQPRVQLSHSLPRTSPLPNSHIGSSIAAPAQSYNIFRGCHFLPKCCVLSLYPRAAQWCPIPSSNSVGFSIAWFQMNHIWSYFWNWHQLMLGLGFI